MCSPSAYSIPQEAEAVFQKGILENPLMQYLPASLKDLSRFVRFEGNALPSIPVNWRWAESISALKALEATMLNYLLTHKYEISPVEVTINTYVQLFRKINVRKAGKESQLTDVSCQGSCFTFYLFTTSSSNSGRIWDSIT